MSEVINTATGKLPLGLALSGGGFRATLFHLGVVRFLFESGLLQKVTHICSVSGGSVIAAHLTLNWERYTGSESDFEEAANELIRFTQRDVRGRVMRRWVFSFLALGVPRIFGKFGRTDLLEKEYDSLYGSRTLRTLGLSTTEHTPPSGSGGSIKRPHLNILATSMTNGQAVSFGPSSFQIRDDENKTEPVDIDTMKVSFAVTASSAFPPLFPPVRVDSENLNLSGTQFQKRFYSRAQYLTDGGVFDNLGVRKFKWIQEEREIQFEKLIVSDAQREFEGDAESRYRFIIGRATRSTDLLMNRISWFENDFILGLGGDGNSLVLRCHLKRRVNPNLEYSLNTDEQAGVHKTRTDLDKFTDDEVNALIHHGYAVARTSYEDDASFRVNENSAAGSLSERNKVWRPLGGKNNTALNLDDSGRRKKNLLSVRDVYSWAAVGLLAVYILAFGLGYKFKVDRDRLAAEEIANKEILAAQERNITFNALRITDALAHLATHEDFKAQDSQEDLENWYRVKDEVIRSSPFFVELFNQDNLGGRIDEAIDIWKTQGQNYKLRNRSVTLGRAVGLSLLRMNNPSYNAWLSSKREEWFQEAEAEAREIARAVKYEHVANGSVKRFWRLYLGDLCLVEGQSVSAAMGRFGEILRDWEEDRLTKPDFNDAFLQLNIALNDERRKDITNLER